MSIELSKLLYGLLVISVRPGFLAGLDWRDVGITPPEGRELNNERLRDALIKKVKLTEGGALRAAFSREEFAGFGITALRPDHFIWASDRYFKPAESQTGSWDVLSKEAVAVHLDDPERWIEGTKIELEMLTSNENAADKVIAQLKKRLRTAEFDANRKSKADAYDRNKISA